MATDWRPIEGSEDTEKYLVDLSSVNSAGSTKWAWVRTNHAKPHDKAQSSKILFEFDCEGRKSRVLQALWFSLQDSEGPLAAADTDIASWMYPVDEAASKALQELVCVSGIQSLRRPVASRTELLSLASLIARLETEIARDAETYQRRPRRKVFGATAVGVNYARYVEDWRLKVEAIGNLSYPQEVREANLEGSVQVLTAIRSDGTLERVEIRRSSGSEILDNAARKITQLAAPFAPFPDSIRKDTDILEIIRTWKFSKDSHQTP